MKPRKHSPLTTKCCVFSASICPQHSNKLPKNSHYSFLTPPKSTICRHHREGGNPTSCQPVPTDPVLSECLVFLFCTGNSRDHWELDSTWWVGPKRLGWLLDRGLSWALKQGYSPKRQLFLILHPKFYKDSAKFRNGALLHRYVSERTVITGLGKRQGFAPLDNNNMDSIPLGPIQLSGKRGLEHQPITRFQFSPASNRSPHRVLFVGLLPVGYSVFITKHPPARVDYY